MSKSPALVRSLGLALILITPSGLAFAYQRYGDGCNSCHGAFTDGTSPKGSVFPQNSKHQMHRAATSMNTACALCHRSNDGNNPFIGVSDGTATNPPIGCTGCHPKEGLRLHHAANGIAECVDCHTGDQAPAPESVPPPYYGTTETNVKNPCNPTASVGINENWTTNGFEGSDTDGDNVYDMADSDCLGAPTSPGEAGAGSTPLRVTSFDKATGALSVSFGIACSATTNHVEYGSLAGLSTYAYSGQVCTIGNTGAATFTVPSGSFFLVVADDATHEGSYGKRRTGGTLSERPEDSTVVLCPKAQNLATRCDP